MYFPFADRDGHASLPAERPITARNIRFAGGASARDVYQYGPTRWSQSAGDFPVVATIIGWAGERAESFSVLRSRRSRYWTKVVLQLFLLAPTLHHDRICTKYRR